MSELKEDFIAMRRRSKAKKKDNKAKSTGILDDLKIPYESKNNGLHLIINYQGKLINFWPSTGNWQYVRSTDKDMHRGIFLLLKEFGISTEKKDYGNHYPNPG